MLARVAAILLIGGSIATPQNLKPATVTEVIRHYDKTGKLLSETKYLYAINSKGSTVVTDLNPNSNGIRQIVDAEKGRNIVVNTKAKSATITPAEGQIKPITNCREGYAQQKGVEIATQAGATMIQGFVVDRISMKFPGGGSSEIYKAPALGCHTLRIVVRDKVGTREEQSVVEIKRGEPDAAWFEIPKEYRVTTK